MPVFLAYFAEGAVGATGHTGATGLTGVTDPTGPGSTLVRKTSNQTVTNSATLTNDTELTMALAANTSYEFEAFIYWTEDGNTNTDGQFAFTVPASSTLLWVGVNHQGSTTTTNSTGIVATSGASATPVAGGAIPVSYVYRIRGYVTTGATAGNLTLQFANAGGTAGSTDTTTVNAGSFIKLGKFN